ncbi:MAG: hypothetical protein Q7T74_06505 [Candidatus Saccharibacteria bacterium]|nr:hypothetical protein [Candidatus Saccharibacteria bacterium]
MRMLSRILNKTYYLLTGSNVKELQKSNENNIGVMKALETLSPELKTTELSEICGSISEESDCQELRDLFAHYGSDKSTKHDYYLVYAFLLKAKRGLPLKILEIGLGTNNIHIPSNMGKEGKPGASLRAFRDWGTKFLVYGADVDKDILFSEERITTYFVDQTKTESLQELASHFSPDSLDLIIDDGLHTPWANLNTLNLALNLVKPGGYVVIEDILDRYLSTWKVAIPLIPGNCMFLRCKSATVLLVQKI